MEALAFDNVSLIYETDGRSSVALSDVDLRVAAGESVAIIGPSGCGKTSILKLACALRRPTEGSVRVEGAPLEAPRSDVAYIPQDFGILPWKSVLANAELGLKLRGVSRAERRQKAVTALDAVGLSGFERSRPSELSGGMKQRLALARALALDVDLLLLDEPLSAIDWLLREQLQDMLLELWQSKGYAQMLVTHSIEEAVFLGQRIVIMSARPGTVVAQVLNARAGSADYRESAPFHEMCDRVRRLLAEGASVSTADAFEPVEAAKAASR